MSRKVQVVAILVLLGTVSSLKLQKGQIDIEKLDDCNSSVRSFLAATFAGPARKALNLAAWVVTRVAGLTSISGTVGSDFPLVHFGQSLETKVCKPIESLLEIVFDRAFLIARHGIGAGVTEGETGGAFDLYSSMRDIIRKRLTDSKEQVSGENNRVVCLLQQDLHALSASENRMFGTAMASSSVKTVLLPLSSKQKERLREKRIVAKLVPISVKVDLKLIRPQFKKDYR